MHTVTRMRVIEKNAIVTPDPPTDVEIATVLEVLSSSAAIKL